MHNDGQYLGVHTLGDVAFEPAGLNVIIAHGVVEHVDWRKEWKRFFDGH